MKILVAQKIKAGVESIYVSLVVGKSGSLKKKKPAIVNKIEGEIWAPVDGYNGRYLISSHGRVLASPKTYYDKRKNCMVSHSAKLLKLITTDKGYLRVCLVRDKSKKEIKFVHRLVAIAFIPNPTGLPFINHINLVKSDNLFDNLEWVTQRENVTYNYFMKVLPKTSKYTGVSWVESKNKWAANICIDGKYNSLGCYSDEMDASLAYQSAIDRHWLENKYMQK